MKPIFKLLFTFAVILCISFSARASHYLGGEITWKCTSNGQYEFTVIIYKECASNAATYVSKILRGSALPGGQVTLTQVKVEDISPTCLGGSGIFCGMTTGIDPNDPNPSGDGAVQKFTLKATVALNGVPPTAGWTFYWQDAARPQLVNTNESYYYLRAKMYPYIPVGANSAKNSNPCYDSSPEFSEQGGLTICAGAPFTYNHLASDRDLDSLYVRFASPLGNGGSPIAFSSGYSIQSPYPSNLSHPSSNNGPITLDGKTGEVSMNIQTATRGSYASCYVIEAWKCGQGPNGPMAQLVAEVFRDVTIVVQTGCAANDEPQVSIDTSVYVNINQNGPKNYSTTVYPGDTINFELIASDPNFNFGANQFQYIYFNAAGLQASNPLSSGTGCAGPAPCATFTPVAPQTGYSNQLSNKQTFFWVPDCQHLNVAGNFCSPFNTFYFSMRMVDDGCPAPRISLTTFIVKVVAGDPSPLQLKCLAYIPQTRDIRLSWDRAIVDSGLGFNYYMLLGAPTVNGTYDTLQYITDIDSLSTIVGPSGGYKHFYMIKSTGKCDFLSEPSDTLSLMEMSLTATPPGSAEFANLSWTPLHTPLGLTTTGLYEIWTEAPAGSGNWSHVGSTPNLTYTDTVTVCNSLVNYQIRVTDTVRGCQSMSTIDSARFSDKTNNDALVLDSASVSGGGNALISWSNTKYPDVVSYYLYFNDPKLGWIIVDTIPVGTSMPHEWPGSQADTRSEQFKVISVDSCGNQSDDQVVKPHSTIYLRNYLNKCEAYSRISWNTYDGFGKAVVGYRLMVRTATGGGPFTPWSVLATAGPQDTSYLQYNLVNGTDYCYRVQVFDTLGRTSTSNELCITAEVPRKSRVLYLAQVTNDPDRNALVVNTFVDGQADVQTFNVERAPSELGPYTTIGKVDKPVAQPYVVRFEDYGALASQRHYYYRLSATDSCGGRDTISNLSRNILLQVEARPNLTNKLTWNPYTSWLGDVARYEIYRKAADENSYSLAGNTAGDDTTFVDDISDYRETPGNFCYYVKAIEGKNSLGYVMDNGLPFNSRSNERCLNQSARVYIPTAFRPGSEIEENRYFGPSMKFNEVSEYHFYILNRWGVKVFETFSPEERWDGSYNGADAQQGVYIYFLKYSTPGGIPVEERGDFTLIR